MHFSVIQISGAPTPAQRATHSFSVFFFSSSGQKSTSYSISKDIPLYHTRYNTHSVQTETFGPWCHMVEFSVFM